MGGGGAWRGEGNGLPPRALYANYRMGNPGWVDGLATDGLAVSEPRPTPLQLKLIHGALTSRSRVFLLFLQDDQGMPRLPFSNTLASFNAVLAGYVSSQRSGCHL